MLARLQLAKQVSRILTTLVLPVAPLQFPSKFRHPEQYPAASHSYVPLQHKTASWGPIFSSLPSLLHTHFLQLNLTHDSQLILLTSSLPLLLFVCTYCCSSQVGYHQYLLFSLLLIETKSAILHNTAISRISAFNSSLRWQTSPFALQPHIHGNASLWVDLNQFCFK